MVALHIPLPWKWRVAKSQPDLLTSVKHKTHPNLSRSFKIDVALNLIHLYTYQGLHRSTYMFSWNFVTILIISWVDPTWPGTWFHHLTSRRTDPKCSHKMGEYWLLHKWLKFMANHTYMELKCLWFLRRWLFCTWCIWWAFGNQAMNSPVVLCWKTTLVVYVVWYFIGDTTTSLFKRTQAQ